MKLLKLIVLSLLFFFSYSAYSQSNQLEYCFNKEQHDKIRQNLKDYRELIDKFNQLKIEFDNLKEQHELIVALKNNNDLEIRRLTTDNKRLQGENFGYNNLKIQHENLKNNYHALEYEILKLNKQLEHVGKSAILYHRKYSRQISLTREDRVIAGVAWGVVTGCFLLVIYNDYKNSHIKP